MSLGDEKRSSASPALAFLVTPRALDHCRRMTLLKRFYLVLADTVLVLHFSFVAFVILGLVLIWMGRWRRWPWVRNFWFRMSHLLAIGVVAAESLVGFICPLTTWEDRLRLLAGGDQRYEGSFVQHWLHRLMFFDRHQQNVSGR